MSTQDIEMEATAYGPVATSSLTSTAAGMIASAAAFVGRAIEAHVRYRTLKAAERQLMTLDDRMLKDIGLDRSEIMSALLNAESERLNGAQLIQAFGN